MPKWLGACCVFGALACAQPQAAGPITQLRAAPKPSAPSRPIQHVVLVTIDGLLPDSYLHPEAHGLRVPTLQRFVAEGAVSDGALSTFPSVTYPAHTTIATGSWPKHHGIIGNRSFDPLETNREAWFWYAEAARL
ncbi:MAG: hypothetical protein RL701_5919 [Pseudomonadota bacterium]|jgi:predicted AlkP superfamily pyrophosphatase or phosphodiesterase